MDFKALFGYNKIKNGEYYDKSRRKNHILQKTKQTYARGSCGEMFGIGSGRIQVGNDLSAPDVLLIPKLAELFGITCDELLGAKREEVTAVAPELINLNKMLFRIKIKSADGDNVKINIPLSLAEVFLKSGVIKKDDKQSNGLEKIDFEQVISLVKLGAIGKLFEIVSGNGDIIEGWIE